MKQASRCVRSLGRESARFRQRVNSANRASNPADRNASAAQPVSTIRASQQPKKGFKMKKFGFATLIASSMTAAVLGLAVPAQATTGTPIGPHYGVDNHDNVN